MEEIAAENKKNHLITIYYAYHSLPSRHYSQTTAMIDGCGV